MVQHMTAFQTSSLIGHDYGGVSDAHNMVIVVGKMYAEVQHGGASEPTGSSAASEVIDLTGPGGAPESAAEIDVCRLLCWEIA